MSSEDQQSGALSVEDQAEYDRLEALEEREAAEQRAQDNRADANYPVRNAAVNWSDASNGGDTSREAKATYDTPWGRRELSALEVRDLEQQGHTLTPVDAEPETSLQAERDEMSRVDLDFRQD